MAKETIKVVPDIDFDTDTIDAKENHLILHNDDVHTFDYVIDTLIEVCSMDLYQAEQCTFLVHYKGKCDIKRGTYTELKPYKDELINRELNATID